MSNIIIFVSSFLICLLAIFFERLIGIGWDFHPDAVYYLANYSRVVREMSVLNNLYYFLVYLCNGSYAILILINICIYSVTNILMINLYKRNLEFFQSYRSLALVITIVVFITPYRLHLAIHALKDTFIIFLLLFSVIKQGIFNRSILLLLLTMFRIVSGIYFIIFLRWKIICFIFFGIGLICYLFDLGVVNFFLERLNAQMHAREFDTIPNFTDGGLMGLLTKMATWPILLLTGSFYIISPVLLFLFLALEMFFSISWRYFVGVKIESYFALFILLATLAGLVDSFTSFIRYSYPAIVILPFIRMRQICTESDKLY